MKEGLDPTSATDSLHKYRRKIRDLVQTNRTLQTFKTMLQLYFDLMWHGTNNGGFNKIRFFYQGGFTQAFDYGVLKKKPVVQPDGQSDQMSTSEFVSSVLGRVSRSSPPFQTKCHAQELATNSCFLSGCFNTF